jgi:dolichol-phosphate mannosyltransferase
MSEELPDQPSVVVVVPTYNERPNVEALVLGVLRQGPNYRLIIVDDNSPDGTGQLADALAATHPGRLDVIHRPAKKGLGPAYIAGFERALQLAPELVAQMDADLSHDPEALPRLVAAARHADLAIGSRYVPGGETVGWPLWRRALSRMGGIYARTVLGAPVNDLTSGYKVWRRPLLEQIGLIALRSDGYAFTIEATWRAVRAGARVTEVPIVFSDRVAGASKLSRRIVIEAAFIVWKLRWETRSTAKLSPVQGHESISGLGTEGSGRD